jgi:hypothetical protein
MTVKTAQIRYKQIVKKNSSLSDTDGKNNSLQVQADNTKQLTSGANSQNKTAHDAIMYCKLFFFPGHLILGPNLTQYPCP